MVDSDLKPSFAKFVYIGMGQRESKLNNQKNPFKRLQ